MFDLQLLLAFLAAVTILTVTPGVDTAMVLRAATGGGTRPAIGASLGIALGCLAWGVVASLGLGAVLRASELAYTVVKMAGAAYLVWLGIKLLRKPRDSMDDDRGVSAQDSRAVETAQMFCRGFITNILNPKIGVFYITFLPQFVPQGAQVAIYSFFLACLHVLLTLAWFTVLIAATVPLGRFLRQPRAIRILDRLTGGVFVAFGLKLATSNSH